MNEKTELIPLEDINAAQLFSSDDEVKSIIERIDKAARSITPDVSTKKGKDEIASLAHKVARSKTFLDGIGKDLVSEIKEKAKAIDARRKQIRDTLDALKIEVRKPLTEIEEAEKARVKVHEDNLAELENLLETAAHLQDIEEIHSCGNAASLIMERPFEEYQEGADRVYSKLSALLDQRIAEGEKRQAEEAELKKLRKEKEEREKKEREERIAREAAEHAQREAEEKIKAAEEEAKRAKEEAEEAEKRKQAEIEAAREQERQEAERKVQQEKAEAAKREANRKHRSKINNEALASLVVAGLSDSDAKKAVTAIAKGNVAHISILY